MKNRKVNCFRCLIGLLLAMLILLALGYVGYFMFVMIQTFDSSEESDVRLIWVSSLVIIILVGRCVMKKYEEKLNRIVAEILRRAKRAEGM